MLLQALDGHGAQAVEDLHDLDRARTVLHTALSAVNGARVVLAPYLPFSAAAHTSVSRSSGTRTVPRS